MSTLGKISRIILAAGTVDSQVARSLEHKDMTPSTLLEVLKERKQEVRMI